MTCGCLLALQKTKRIKKDIIRCRMKCGWFDSTHRPLIPRSSRVSPDFCRYYMFMPFPHIIVVFSMSISSFFSTWMSLNLFLSFLMSPKKREGEKREKTLCILLFWCTFIVLLLCSHRLGVLLYYYCSLSNWCPFYFFWCLLISIVV